MRCQVVAAALLFLFVNTIAAQGDIRLRVLSYQWTTSHHPIRFSWQGESSTSCSSTSRVDGSISDTGNFNAYGTSNGMCNTTFTPPGNETIDIKKPVVFILAETPTTRMILTCTRNVMWSQCEALSPGSFIARNESGHFEVQSILKGKAVWTRYDVVQQAAIVKTAPVMEIPKEAKVSIEASPGSASGSATGFPVRWKSMNTGSVRSIRFQGDYLYAELVMTETQAKAGAFSLTELKKDGVKYIGTVSTRSIKQDGASCSFHGDVEITVVTPERIEGRALGPPPNSKLDWTTCSFSAPFAWESFVWIPVQ